MAFGQQVRFWRVPRHREEETYPDDPGSERSIRAF